MVRRRATIGPRRRTGAGPLVLVSLHADSVEPLYRQIYRDLRARILDGTLGGGGRLPSTRSLAQDLRVSRATVVLAYELLRAEGYLESTGRGATHVSRTLPDRLTRGDAAAGSQRPSVAVAAASRRGRRVARAWPHFRPVADLPPRAFRTSVPALDVFPVELWGRLMARRWRRSRAASLAYGNPRGLPALRRAIAGYLAQARGVRCSAEQVLVTTGSQQALDLAGRVLLDPGESVVDGGSWLHRRSARHSSRPAQGWFPFPVDRDGLDVAEGLRRAPRARMAFVTPAHQMPLGVTLSLAPQARAARWAGTRRAWILEDDYDSEYPLFDASLVLAPGNRPRTVA